MNDLSVCFIANHNAHDAYDDELWHIVDELAFRCYAHNRTHRPDIAPARWRAVFGARAPLLELRFQADRLLLACGNRPLNPPAPPTDDDDLTAAAEWTNLGPGYGEE